MGQGWANNEETTFLQGFMPQYETCQVKRNYQTFWPGLFAAYQAQFPLIEKIWPHQSKTLETLTDEENEVYNKKLKSKHESLKEWFRWRNNPRSRNTTNAVTKKDLKSIYQQNRTRGPKNYEVFAKLFRDTVDPIVDDACRAQGVQGKAKLPIWHKTASRLWKNASNEEIEAVNTYIESEAGRDKGSEHDDDPNGDASPETFQHFLKLLPGVLTATIDPAVRKAGVIALCTFIGPVPEAGGQIVATTLQFGDSEGTPLFTSVWPGHEEVFIEHLGRFARKYEFSEELCGRRSFSAAEGEGKQEEAFVGDTNQDQPGTAQREDRTSPTQSSSPVQTTSPALPGSSPQSGSVAQTGNPPIDPPPNPVQATAPVVASPSSGHGTSVIHRTTDQNLAPAIPAVSPSAHTIPEPTQPSPSIGQVLPDWSRQLAHGEPTIHPSLIPISSVNLLQTAQQAQLQLQAFESPLQEMYASSDDHPLPNGYPSYPPPPHELRAPRQPPTLAPSALGSDQLYGPHSVSQDQFSSSGLFHDGDLQDDMPSLLEDWDVSSAAGISWEKLLESQGNQGIDLSSYQMSNSTDKWGDISVFNLIANQAAYPNPGLSYDRPLQSFPDSNARAAPHPDMQPFNAPRIPAHRLNQLLPIQPHIPVQPTTSGVAVTPYPHHTIGQSAGLQSAGAPPAMANMQGVSSPSSSTGAPLVTGGASQIAAPITTNAQGVSSPSSSTGAPLVTGGASQIAAPITTNAPLPPPNNEGSRSNSPSAATPFMLSMNAGFGSSLFGQGKAQPSSASNKVPFKEKKKRAKKSPFLPSDKENHSSEPAKSSTSTLWDFTPKSTVAYAPPAVPQTGPPSIDPPPIVPPETNPLQPSSLLPSVDTSLSLASQQDAATRRSSRGPVKNTWHEKQHLIGTNTISQPSITSMSAATPDEDGAPPPWFTDAVAYLQVEDLGDLWKMVVEKWIGLESSLGYGKVAKTPLPVHDRPEEWSKWASKTKHGVRPYDNTPTIGDPAEFGLAILKWWYSIQPSFRSSTTNFPSPVFADPGYKGDPWVAIRKSGPNGFIVLMTLLAWWGRSLSTQSAFKEDSRPSWTLLVQDIGLCLEELSKPVRKLVDKRDRDDDSDENIEHPAPNKRQKV